jgi:hypothetical protein
MAFFVFVFFSEFIVWRQRIVSSGGCRTENTDVASFCIRESVRRLLPPQQENQVKGIHCIPGSASNYMGFCFVADSFSELPEAKEKGGFEIKKRKITDI